MPRAFLIVMDSAGCGGAPDAAEFGDAGANTLGHIARACAEGEADVGRSGPLNIPVMAGLGLGAAIELASGLNDHGLPGPNQLAWGAATEVSKGKDTPSGHWELAGVPVPWNWHYFPDAEPAFPSELAAKVANIARTEGILGNCHASGTAIVESLGAEHVRTGWPICYTSADSVFQVAAHEEVFGLERLLNLCKALAPDLHKMRVGRVIARPFVGSPENGFERTKNRKDFAIEPPEPTLCDWVFNHGGKVHGIGKINDIFSGRGLTDGVKGTDAELMRALFDRADGAEDGSLTFANFVEFDTNFGHRRDVPGYARALEWFDSCLPQFLAKLGPNDLAIISADHGNDPTWHGTDHTRERVPVLAHGGSGQSIGHCDFVDVAASIADHLGLDQDGRGRSFL